MTRSNTLPCTNNYPREQSFRQKPVWLHHKQGQKVISLTFLLPSEECTLVLSLFLINPAVTSSCGLTPTNERRASSSSSSSYARRRCLLPSRKRLSSSAPPGYHRAAPSVVSVLATCPASEHHVVGSAAVDVLQS